MVFVHWLREQRGIICISVSTVLAQLTMPNHRRYATTDGTRYFWEARYITATFDASPQVLIETDRLLKNEEGILRSFTVRMKSGFDKVKERSYRNPYAKPDAPAGTLEADMKRTLI